MDIMSSFFEELQRRKVYRAAVAYIVAAGFLIQIASAAFPAWELPNWSLRLVIALLLIGFPIVLILAWAYDVTPRGIQVTPGIPGTHRRRNLTLLIVIAAISSATAGFFLLPRVTARKIDKSIAVMPFENLSDLHWPGRGFLVQTRFFTLSVPTPRTRAVRGEARPR
jgi:hypothetical protein